MRKNCYQTPRAYKFQIRFQIINRMESNYIISIFERKSVYSLTGRANVEFSVSEELKNAPVNQKPFKSIKKISFECAIVQIREEKR